MRTDYQTIVFDIIKRQIKSDDNLGNAVGEILSISSDAVYRRYRGETQLTIFELEKLCIEFNISLDSLFELNKNKVIFDFSPFNEYDFSLDSYLQGILDGMTAIKTLKNPQLLISVYNAPFLHLLNFPHLIRFKLFIWAKTHLQIEEYKDSLFKYEKISEKTFTIGRDILFNYNSVPSKEIFDIELLGGYVKEIYYYFESHQFEDPEYAIHLLDKLDEFLDHLKAEAIIGKKFMYGTEPPLTGNDFEMYYNPTIIPITSIHYKSDDYSGLYIAHNIMNTLHTTDEVYIADSVKILNKQILNSSLISIVNEKERNNYFFQIKSMINKYRKKIQLEVIL